MRASHHALDDDMRFANRHDAGRRLAAALTRVSMHDPLVVGLPRGGVPVAFEVARELGAPLDVVLVRKLGCPWHRELGVGALGEGGIQVRNRRLMRSIGVTDEELEEVARRETIELERRHELYRGRREPLEVTDRTVIVVDDGLATGFTARAALEVLRRRGARRLVLAVPVAPPEAVRELSAVADEVVCLHAPAAFGAIGQFYDDFSQTSDEEVAELLTRATATSGTPEVADQGGDHA